jgi:hypothetical protein
LKDWHRVEFEVQTEPDADSSAQESAIHGRIAFYLGPILIGEAQICAYITDETDAGQRDAGAELVSTGPYRRIFVSYSHADAKIVDALEVAYKALGDTYLRDVHTLRAGDSWNPALVRLIENAEIFQLCWSTAAKASEYVRREWVHALNQSRAYAFIRPTYWELPMPEPPAELKGIHFDYLQL